MDDAERGRNRDMEDVHVGCEMLASECGLGSSVAGGGTGIGGRQTPGRPRHIEAEPGEPQGEEHDRSRLRNGRDNPEPWG